MGPSSANPSAITYRVCPEVTNEQLDVLFAASWPDHTPSDTLNVLSHSLAYICAFHTGQLIGFVNIAWDGGVHAFLLDTTVHPDYRRHGIGRRLVAHATKEARTRDIEWLHVDYMPQLEGFYAQCGFRPTRAGLINLRGEDEAGAQLPSHS